MKRIAAFVTILCLSACGEESKPAPQTFVSDELSANRKALAKEICLAIGQTRRFDSSARRDIFKDYGISLRVIAEMEGNTLLGDAMWCPEILVTAQRCVDKPEFPGCDQR